DGRVGEFAAVAAALAEAAGNARAGSVVARLGGWRNLPSEPQRRSYRVEPGGQVHEVRYRLRRGGYEVVDGPVAVAVEPGLVVLEIDGVARRFSVARYGDRVEVDGGLGACSLSVLPRFPEPEAEAVPGSLLAPMPGTVVRVAEGLAVGGRVVAGQPLLWLEAMKMQHQINAPADGTLTALPAGCGSQVEVGALLAVVEPDEM
ncbi:acetyl-CoA carboxylase biotin carboxyl carrier protein subunit, partial [Streptomyces palmae]